LRPRMGGDAGFTIHIGLSLVFVAAILIGCLLPFRKTAEAVTQAKRAAGQWRAGLRWFLSGRFLAWLGNRSDALAAIIAVLVFLIGYPNLWGDPVGGFLQHWFGFYGRVGAAPVRAWFFITQTVYLPLYYYFVMIPLHAHPLYLLSIILGAVWSIRLLRREPLEQFRAARGLLMIFCWLGAYTAMTGAGGAYKKMQIATSFYPWLSMLAGIGLAAALRWAYRRIPGAAKVASERAVGGVAAALIAICLAPAIASQAPYTYLYTSPLLGAPNRLSRIDWLSGDCVTGWEKVPDYLRSIGREGAKVAAIGGGYNLSFFYPQTLNGDAMDLKILPLSGADYVAIHVQDKQRWPWRPLIRHFADRKPVHTIAINGIDVIWIYDATEPSPA
jgi:hypothetical protein